MLKREKVVYGDKGTMFYRMSSYGRGDSRMYGYDRRLEIGLAAIHRIKGIKEENSNEVVRES